MCLSDTGRRQEQTSESLELELLWTVISYHAGTGN